LEELAQKLAQFHVSRLGLQIEQEGGIEYWVQVLDAQDKSAAESIPWHRDKDEGRYLRCGEEKYPAVATVTYLSGISKARESCGQAPTVVLSPVQVVVSYPAVAKHLAFAGSLLHGCPTELILNNESCERQSDGRITLLVNIWPDMAPEGFASVSRANAQQPKKKKVKNGEKLMTRQIGSQEAPCLMQESIWQQAPLCLTRDELLRIVLEEPSRLNQALTLARERWRLALFNIVEENEICTDDATTFILAATSNE
jgi:hypothetical protein